GGTERSGGIWCSGVHAWSSICLEDRCSHFHRPQAVNPVQFSASRLSTLYSTLATECQASRTTCHQSFLPREDKRAAPPHHSRYPRPRVLLLRRARQRCRRVATPGRGARSRVRGGGAAQETSVEVERGRRRWMPVRVARQQGCCSK